MNSSHDQCRAQPSTSVLSPARTSAPRRTPRCPTPAASTPWTFQKSSPTALGTQMGLWPSCHGLCGLHRGPAVVGRPPPHAHRTAQPHAQVRPGLEKAPCESQHCPFLRFINLDTSVLPSTRLHASCKKITSFSESVHCQLLLPRLPQRVSQGSLASSNSNRITHVAAQSARVDVTQPC